MPVTVTIPTPPKRHALRLTVLVCALALILVGISKAPINHIEPFDLWVNGQWDSVATKMAVVRKFDAAADKLPDEDTITTKDDMVLWAIEALPYMVYEGIIVNRQGGAVIPESLELFWRMDSRAFHLGGSAACRDLADNPANHGIVLNGRYTNPVSPWFGKEVTLGVLVHELIHMQHGPFCSGLSEDLEPNTQIATMEVLAAMVNHGNRKALKPLLMEIRAIGLSALQYELPRDEFREFLGSIEDDPYELARQEKAWRFWGDNPELTDILRKYNAVPFNALIAAAYTGTYDRIQVEQPYTCCGPLAYGPLKADDWQWFVLHMDELVEAR